jgi:hypothetical protein
MPIEATSKLRSMVQRRAPITDIASHLESLSAARRVEEVLSVTGALVGELYELASGTEPLHLGDLVPDTTPAGATVSWEGRNSLPAFSRFQKRFTRTADGLVFGYNAGLSRPVVGPGYFLVTEATAEHPGELLLDYTQPPPFEPAGWPAFVPNDKAFSIFVFKDMHDFVRRVARGVVVGSAYKRGVKQRQWFSLTLPV